MFRLPADDLFYSDSHCLCVRSDCDCVGRSSSDVGRERRSEPFGDGQPEQSKHRLERDLRQRRSYRVALPLAAVVVVVFTLPQATFLVIAVLYSLSAPASFLFSRLRRRRVASPHHQRARR